jgi:hypothetical protein
MITDLLSRAAAAVRMKKIASEEIGGDLGVRAWSL